MKVCNIIIFVIYLISFFSVIVSGYSVKDINEMNEHFGEISDSFFYLDHLGNLSLFYWEGEVFKHSYNISNLEKIDMESSEGYIASILFYHENIFITTSCFRSCCCFKYASDESNAKRHF